MPQKTSADTGTSFIIASLRRSQATTGGGTQDLPPLDEFETRVAMDPEAIAGISGGLDVGAPSADEQPDNPFIAELSIRQYQDAATWHMKNSGKLYRSSQQDGDSATEEQELFEHILENKKKILRAQKGTARALERILQVKLHKHRIHFEGNRVVPNYSESN
ncbi:uncharacterized protein LOC142776274 [Rhipicephalus microplus]|uniref:uncharacterized protein LOC142776274 n=1 Tax=Rhipicephalus microplus TaxID=6941 RepID=UPI003F6C283F